MQLLRDIIADGGLATAEKKQQFLTILTEKHAEIEDFLNNRPARFTEYFSASLQGLDVETGKRIYAGLDQTSFTKSKSDFIREVNEAADQERASSVPPSFESSGMRSLALIMHINGRNTTARRFLLWFLLLNINRQRDYLQR